MPIIFQGWWSKIKATPLKPYKVRNICYMTYSYSVLYFLNLSLKHFFFPPTENGNFCENIQSGDRNHSVFYRVAHAQSTYFPIEDRRHCMYIVTKCISLLN